MPFKKLNSIVVPYSDMMKQHSSKKSNSSSLADNVFAGAVAGVKAGLFPLGTVFDIAKALNRIGGLTEDDTENVNRIISSGKKNNVDNMSIEMNRDQWLGLKGKASLGGEADAEIAFGTGGSTGYRIDVKYK